MTREIRYSEETRAAIARMIELNPELERAIFNIAELAYASIEDSLGLELRIMRATIEVLSELEGQNLERIIEMTQDMISHILQFGELGVESSYITKYCDVPSEDIRGIIDKITERWRSEYELCVSAYSCDVKSIHSIHGRSIPPGLWRHKGRDYQNGHGKLASARSASI